METTSISGIFGAGNRAWEGLQGNFQAYHISLPFSYCSLSICFRILEAGLWVGRKVQEESKCEFLCLLLSVLLSTWWIQGINHYHYLFFGCALKRAGFAHLFESCRCLLSGGDSRLHFWRTQPSKSGQSSDVFPPTQHLHQWSWSAESHLGKPVAHYCTQLTNSLKDGVGAWALRLWSLLLVCNRWVVQLNAILYLGFCLSQMSRIHHLHHNFRFSS